MKTAILCNGNNWTIKKNTIYIYIYIFSHQNKITLLQRANNTKSVQHIPLQ